MGLETFATWHVITKLNADCVSAIAQAVSRRPGFETRSGHVGFVVDKVVLGQIFSEPILIPPTAPHSSSIIQGWNNKPNSGRRKKWTQSHPTTKNLKKHTVRYLRTLPISRIQYIVDHGVIKWIWGSWRNENWKGKPKYLKINHPSVTLSTIHPTWNCGGKPLYSLYFYRENGLHLTERPSLAHARGAYRGKGARTASALNFWKKIKIEKYQLIPEIKEM
jgi:hypothetical protein